MSFIKPEFQHRFPSIKKWLKQYGYLGEVNSTELASLDEDSLALKNALEKFQNFYDYNLIGDPDGIAGPKTLYAMSVPRCGHPDFEDPEFGFRAIGKGSWPEPCQKAGVKVSVDKSKLPSKLKASIDSIIQRVFKAYAGVGLKLVLVDSDANIRVSWRNLAGSTIGLAEFNNESCSDSVFCYLDPSYAPNDQQVVDLLAHEMGHNCNLEHTRGSDPNVMNSYILTAASDPWSTKDPSYKTLVKYFSGEPIDQPIIYDYLLI